MPSAFLESILSNYVIVRPLCATIMHTVSRKPCLRVQEQDITLNFKVPNQTMVKLDAKHKKHFKASNYSVAIICKVCKYIYLLLS